MKTIEQIKEIQNSAGTILNECLNIFNGFCLHDIKHQKTHSPLEEEQSLNLLKQSAEAYLVAMKYYNQVGGIITLGHLYQEKRIKEMLRNYP